MKKIWVSMGALSFLFLMTSGRISAFPSLETAKKNARILVGPNILVSRDGDVPHVELMAAANPKKVKHLLGTAITFTRPDGSTACKTYASKDGGYTWADSSFPEQVEFGGGDPQVAFGLNGTAYFCALTDVRDDAGKTRAGLLFYRSEDGGTSWGKMTDLGYSYDHEQIVVDHSFGQYAGRIYIGTLYGYPEYQVGVFRSDDDGKSFVGPVKCASGQGKIGINVCNMLILSDGSLFVPYGDFPFRPEESKKTDRINYWFVTSQDGGVTFALPKSIGYQQHAKYDEMIKARKAGSFIRTGFAMFAADGSTSAFKDRIYAAWDDVRFGRQRILFSYSKDRGETWTEAKALCPQVPEWASQFQPMVFVNNEGTLGVMWYDTRASKLDDQFHLYFTASTDGGETFLAPVRVSSAPSFPAGDTNLVPGSLFISSGKESIKLSGISAHSRWGNGGDYMGLTADVNGVFHPFWADSRAKGYEIWTSQVIVQVEEEKSKDEETVPEEEKSKQRGPLKMVQAPLNSQIELVYDPIKYDAKMGVATIPIRLKNISQEPLFGPLSVRVKALVDEEQKKYSGEGWENIPEIINAANDLKGPGAVFDYSGALRDFESLEPGAITEAVGWKLKFLNPKFSDLFLEVEVTGFIQKK